MVKAPEDLLTFLSPTGNVMAAGILLASGLLTGALVVEVALCLVHRCP